MVSLVVSLHSLISSESGYMSQSKVADNISDVAINAAHGSNIAGRIDEIEKKITSKLETNHNQQISKRPFLYVNKLRAPDSTLVHTKYPKLIYRSLMWRKEQSAYVMVVTFAYASTRHQITHLLWSTLWL